MKFDRQKFIIVFLFFLTIPFADKNRDRNFGKNWVRNNPFTIIAPVLHGAAVKNNNWVLEGRFNTIFAWKHREQIYEAAIRQQIPYHLHVNKVHLTQDGILPELKTKVEKINENYPNMGGILVYDEPKLPDFSIVSKGVSEVKDIFPDALIYSNASPISPLEAFVYSSPDRAGAEYLGDGIYDDTSIPFSYDDYLDEFIRTINPDILMADVYPFWIPEYLDPDWYLKNKYFLMLSALRKAGLMHDIPYWIFVQSYGKENRYRFPSESDVRMQVYSSLAFGFTGIAYFTYDNGMDKCLLDQNFARTNLYDYVSKLNLEIINLGKVLKFLTSTDIRYVLANGVTGGGSLMQVPIGLMPFYHKSRVAKLLRGISFIEGKPDHDCLIGFFKDDNGGLYFMVVNLWHDEKLNADQTKMMLTLEFDNSVKKIGRLSRMTGKSELLFIDDGRINITLPGGTGDLFKFGDTLFNEINQIH